MCIKCIKLHKKNLTNLKFELFRFSKFPKNRSFFSRAIFYPSDSNCQIASELNAGYRTRELFLTRCLVHCSASVPPELQTCSVVTSHVHLYDYLTQQQQQQQQSGTQPHSVTALIPHTSSIRYVHKSK